MKISNSVLKCRQYYKATKDLLLLFIVFIHFFNIYAAQRIGIL